MKSSSALICRMLLNRHNNPMNSAHFVHEETGLQMLNYLLVSHRSNWWSWDLRLHQATCHNQLFQSYCFYSSCAQRQASGARLVPRTGLKGRGINTKHTWKRWSSSRPPGLSIGGALGLEWSLPVSLHDCLTLILQASAHISSPQSGPCWLSYLR